MGVKWLHGHSGVTPSVSPINGGVVASASTSTGAAATITNALSPTDVHAAELLQTHADFISAFDSQATGTATRDASTDGKSADYNLLVYLPGLDPKVETYAVWLLKDGLADVKRMGELSARADGSWTLDFTAGPVSGIASPDAYRDVVIMKEPKGSVNTPSGTKMATASF